MMQDMMAVTPSNSTQEGMLKTQAENDALRAHREKKRHKQNSKAGASKTKGSEMVYWASINIIVINIIIYVLFLTYKSILETSLTVDSANRVLILIGLSLSVLCLILWLGHVTSINEIGSFFAKAIWVGFIASMLTTSVAAYRATIHSTTQEHIKIEKMETLNETYIRSADGTLYLE